MSFSLQSHTHTFINAERKWRKIFNGVAPPPGSNLLMSLTQFLRITKNNNNSHDEEEKVFSLANGSEKVVVKIVKA